jgi:glucosylceramidase
MSRKKLSRREILRASVAGAVAVGAGGAWEAAKKVSAAEPATHAASGAITQQLPPPAPLDDPKWACIVSTEASAWQKAQLYKPAFSFETLNLNITQTAIDAAAHSPAMEGFGACFNELGWISLSALSDADRDAVMSELFDPTGGARFTYCRMPIGANDYARETYSHDETDGDFTMQHFSIAHDKDTLVPFIQAAKKHQPALNLWASPWSPPTWMKRNHFYAEAKAIPGFNKENGIKPEQIGHEGEDMFIQEPRYFEAYALYFQKFIEAYRAEGIQVGMVMPQNEFNSAQNFPSCTWTPGGLAWFISYLAPAMQKIGVDVFFGTLERGNVKLLDTTMNDKKAGKFVKGVGVQWAGKNALADIEHKYPSLPIFASEQECGFGTNTWVYSMYCWQLMKEYFRRGARAYMYWNLATAKGGLSTWGWPQNSLVSVDTDAKTFQWNHDYYVIKHASHFVGVGARRIATSGTCDDALAFANADGSTVVLLRNAAIHSQRVAVQIGEQTATAELPPDSIATLTLAKA